MFSFIQFRVRVRAFFEGAKIIPRSLSLPLDHMRGSGIIMPPLDKL